MLIRYRGDRSMRHSLPSENRIISFLTKLRNSEGKFCSLIISFTSIHSVFLCVCVWACTHAHMRVWMCLWGIDSDEWNKLSFCPCSSLESNISVIYSVVRIQKFSFLENEICVVPWKSFLFKVCHPSATSTDCCPLS